MTTGGAQVPTERLNQLGYPAKEFYFYAGNGLWTKVNPNEKTATQLRKEKTAKRKKNASVNAEATRYARGVSKNALYNECRRLGLAVSGTKLLMATRILAFNNAPTTDDLFVDDEGEVVNPAKEESQ